MRRARGTFDLVIVIPDLTLGGAQRVVTSLASSLVRRGVRIQVVTIAAAQANEFRQAEGVARLALGEDRASTTPGSALWNNARRIRVLRRAIRSSGARVVLSLVGGTNILAVAACANLPVHVVISERNDPSRQSLGRPWDWLRRRVYRHASVVTANSAAAIDAMRSYVPDRKLALVDNPVPEPPPGPAVPRQPIVLAVGRLEHQKAHDVLITAFARVAPAFPEWRLQIVGSGSLESALRLQAGEHQVANRILWQSPVSDIWRFYRAASVFAFPSRFEGTPNALLEAMSAGLPSIISDSVPGALTLVSDGREGKVVPVDAVEPLADALRALMGDEALRERMGAAARRRVAGHSGDAILARWISVLRLDSVVRHPA